MWKALVVLIIFAGIVSVGYLKPSDKPAKKPKYEVVNLDDPPASHPPQEPAYDQAEFEAALVNAFEEEAAKRKRTQP